VRLAEGRGAGRLKAVEARRRGAAAPPPPGGAPAGAAPAAGGGRGPAGPAGAGIPGDSFVRTAGVAWDAQGNIYVADGQGDGIGNARVAKFDKDAHFIKSWGQRGTEPGQFNALRGIALDAKGLVYVADGGNKRIQVFDGDGNPKSQLATGFVPAAICITPGAHQYMYVSNSNDAESLDNGEIYKMELDGKMVGKFGRAGRVPKEFNMVNSIDCRSENELFVGELGNWRVQKLTLHPAK
jgi:DNA-binding beta-propeller fold protein YncE